MKIAQKYYEIQAKNKMQMQNNAAELQELWKKYKKEYIIIITSILLLIAMVIYLIIKFIN